MELVDFKTDDVALAYQGEALDHYDTVWDNAYFSIGKQDTARAPDVKSGALASLPV